MKEKKLPLIAYGLLLACLAFSLGYLLGHGNGTTQINVTAAPQTAAAASESAASESTSDSSTSAVRSALTRSAPSADSPLNINGATAEDLTQLPGIGLELAERIVAYRRQNGPFWSTEQIMDVEGIGEKRYAEIAPLITIGGTP